LRTLADSVDETALDLQAARRISDEQRLLHLRHHALALRHRFLFAGLQVGDRTAVLRGDAFPLGVLLLDERSQPLLFGKRLR